MSTGQSGGVAQLQLVWGALQMPSAQTRASALRSGLQQARSRPGDIRASPPLRTRRGAAAPHRLSKAYPSKRSLSQTYASMVDAPARVGVLSMCLRDCDKGHGSRCRSSFEQRCGRPLAQQPSRRDALRACGPSGARVG